MKDKPAVLITGATSGMGALIPTITLLLLSSSCNITVYTARLGARIAILRRYGNK